MLFLCFAVCIAAVFVLVLAVAYAIVRRQPTSLTMRFLRWVSFRIEWEPEKTKEVETGP